MPGADRVDLDAEALLEETPHRCVVEHLRIDPAALAPRRHDVHRHACAESPGTNVAADRVGAGQDIADGVGEILTRERHRRLAHQVAVDVIRRHRRRRQVIEEAVVLVEGQQEDGLTPDLGIGGQDLQHLVGEIAGAGRAAAAGMLGVGLRRQDPRDLRQRAVRYIGFQLVQIVRTAGQAVHVVGLARLRVAEA